MFNSGSAKQSVFKPVLVSGALLSVLAAPNAWSIEAQRKQEVTALGTIATATAAAGPVGFVAGVLASTWLMEQVGGADQLVTARSELEQSQSALAQAEAQLVETQQALALAEAKQQRYARMALEQLQLEMLFRTGASDLTEQGRARLALLADFLTDNDDLAVMIEGYADPRGDADSNLALSLARAEQVSAVLAAAGVSPDRLKVTAMGESNSTAADGDLDAYALERVVRIGLRRWISGAVVAEVKVQR